MITLRYPSVFSMLTALFICAKRFVAIFKNEYNKMLKMMSNKKVKFSDTSNLLDYLNVIHSELDTRIKNHTQLLLHKVVTTGAMFSFILSIIVKLSEKNLIYEMLILIPLIGLWLVPAISILYDLMISKNISNIHKIGSFIKHKIEQKYFKKHVVLWEAYIGQKEKYMTQDKFNIYVSKKLNKYPDRRYKLKYKDWREFRCYNRLDLKILRIYSSVVICLSFLGSLMITYAFFPKKNLSFLSWGITYEKVGLFISISGLIFYVSWLVYFFLKFEKYILSFYDKGGIPYQIDRKYEPNKK